MRAASTLEFAALLLQARENSRTGLPIATTFNPLVFAERSALSMLTRTRPNSFALSGAFTRSVQSTGRSTGQGDELALIASSPCILAHRPLQMFVALHREAFDPSHNVTKLPRIAITYESDILRASLGLERKEKDGRRDR